MGDVQAKSIAIELQNEFPNLNLQLISNCVHSFKGSIHQRKEFCRIKLQELAATKGFSKNQQLETLDQVFPLVPKRELRRCIRRADDNVFKAADYVLASKISKLGRRAKLAKEDYFQSVKFQHALRNTMLNRYPLLWASSVEQVLIEQNYDAAKSIAVLDELDRRRRPGWFDWWERGRKEVVHSPQLLRELEEIQVAQDRMVAQQVNLHEYQQSGDAIECACCFSDAAYEDLVPCSAGHVFCTDCINNFISNLATGSFGSKATRRHAGGPKCFSIDDCCGVIERKYLSEKQTADIDEFLRQQCFNARTREELDLTLCFYCGDQTRPPRTPQRILVEQKYVFLWLATFMVVIGRVVLRLSMGYIEAAGVIFCYFYYSRSGVLRRALVEWRDKVSGEKPSSYVRCVNPSCSVEFCKSCTGEADHRFPHLCYDGVPEEGTQEALATYVERAMSKVAVRVCPKCLLQFQKEDGCNRMRCQCGYEMCYLCRGVVTDYTHFCEHFRSVPGAKCKECNKCELWRVEDEPNVVHAAREAAFLFRQRHPNSQFGPVVVQGIRV